MSDLGKKGTVTKSMSVRHPNSEHRTREHLAEDEFSLLLEALKRNRHGNRDWLIGLIVYGHGLRASELCDLQWTDIDFTKSTMKSLMVESAKAKYEAQTQLLF